MFAGKVTLSESDADMQQKRRFRRADFHRMIRLFVGTDTILSGVTNDISTHSASMFVSLKGAAAFFGGAKAGEQVRIPFSTVKERLLNQAVLMAFDADDLAEPVNLHILRVEPSWKKGYDIFLGCRFASDDTFLMRKLETVCPGLLPGKEPEGDRYVSESLRRCRDAMQKERAARFTFDYSNKYTHVHAHRDFVARLVSLYEFSEMEQYHVKLLADELLTNAFLYGALEPGRDRTILTLMLQPGRLYFSVRDFAGRVFNDYPFHFRRNEKGTEGGLSLVEAYADDWEVATEEGQHTDVSFFKVSARAEEQT